jgi:hypothetical protein
MSLKSKRVAIFALNPGQSALACLLKFLVQPKSLAIAAAEQTKSAIIAIDKILNSFITSSSVELTLLLNSARNMPLFLKKKNNRYD